MGMQVHSITSHQPYDCHISGKPIRKTPQGFWCPPVIQEQPADGLGPVQHNRRNTQGSPVMSCSVISQVTHHGYYGVCCMIKISGAVQKNWKVNVFLSFQKTCALQDAGCSFNTPIEMNAYTRCRREKTCPHSIHLVPSGAKGCQTAL